MKQLLIIPKQDELKEYLSVAEEYKLVFEYNDFFLPDLLLLFPTATIWVSLSSLCFSVLLFQ